MISNFLMARSHTRTRTHTHAHTHIETQRQTLISDIERIVVRVVIKQSIFLGVGGCTLQGTKALAVPLVTNTSIQKLNMRDNWMEGMGGAAMAEMLKENCYITGGFTHKHTPKKHSITLTHPRMHA